MSRPSAPKPRARQPWVPRLRLAKPRGPNPGLHQGPDHRPGSGSGSWSWSRCGYGCISERGSGTVLAAGLGMVVMIAMVLMLLLAQSAAMASRAAAAADLAALAAADAARGISAGEPCSVAAEVAGRQDARIISCTKEGGETVEIRTELLARSLFGAATGRARAGPPPP